MKKILITALVTFAATLLLFGGHHAPSSKVEAQATTTKPDLITKYRANARKLEDWKAEVRALRNQYDALSFTWANGDFTGANEGITASQFTNAVTNLTQIADAIDAGGTLSAGVNTNVWRIAQ